MEIHTIMANRDHCITTIIIDHLYLQYWVLRRVVKVFRVCFWTKKHTYTSTHISSSLPMVGIQRYGSGFTQVGVDEDSSLGGVYRGHRDGFVSGVSPVQVVLEPVQSQTHGGLQEWIHQRHLLWGITGLVDEGAAGGIGGWKRQSEKREYFEGKKICKS